MLKIHDIFLRPRKGLPPRSLALRAGGFQDYEKTGNEFLGYFKKLCGLRPGHSVLDIGCGVGRMAWPLTSFLSSEGKYQGLEVVKKYVDWCGENISVRFPNFQFGHMDVFNGKCNPKGKISGAEYKFSFPDSAFDFIFLTSVFTHLLQADTENYVAEISRMLKADGRCLATFFLLNDQSLELARSGKSAYEFKYRFDNYALEDERDPEYAVAYSQDYVSELLKRNHLQVRGPVRYGSCCGRQDFTSYQDILVLEKSLSPDGRKGR
jgi:SAM-dependent methyltransferase